MIVESNSSKKAIEAAVIQEVKVGKRSEED
jgi:hypothetical protein